MKKTYRIARLGMIVVYVLIAGEDLHAQDHGGVSVRAVFGTPTKKLRDVLGFGLSADIKVIRNVYLRGGFDLITADTNPIDLFCEKYRRSYLSLSVVVQKNTGLSWLPYVEAGGGYLYHNLKDVPAPDVTAECDVEKINNGVGFHFAAGVRRSVHDNLLFNISIRRMIVKTDFSRTLIVNGTSRTSVFDLDYSIWQIGMGFSYQF